MITAELNNLRQSPRKVRLVADLVKGKGALEAARLLSFTAKAAALPLKKLVESAIKNAENQGAAPAGLFVKEFRVNSGPTLKRIMPRARGSAYQILKRTSKISLVLAERTTVSAEVSAGKEETKRASSKERPEGEKEPRAGKRGKNKE